MDDFGWRLGVNGNAVALMSAGMMVVESRSARWRAITAVRSIVMRWTGVSASPLVLNIDAVLLQRWWPVEIVQALDIFA